MLVNYVPGEECRIAILEDGKLEEFYQERASAESHVGNIYKGKVTNVEPSIQAAFVDFGLDRNGFLHISDLHPMYFPGAEKDETEKVGKKTPRRERPPIQKALRRGDSVLVQVLKEGLSTKGPTLTSYLSIPGRFLVMMPYMDRLGVSRKVDDDEARREARKILADLSPPDKFGFIVRTAGIGQTKADLKRDLAYLTRLWKSIETQQKKIKGVGELYAESDLVIRTIRDVFTSDIERIVVDDITAAKRARDFLAVANPRSKSKVVYYNDPVPLFHRFDVERQIDGINAREVPLPSGGALVFDQTEALVAIDVNSGKSRDARDAESNAFNTNKEAVDEICRQLRLRDLGGLVVNDLIDMRDLKHRRTIEQRFRNNLKKDRARTRIGPISQFGILEMTRQRMRPSLKTSIYNECEHCRGTGFIKSPESVVLDVMRRLALVMHVKEAATLELTISPDVAFQLLNKKRSHLVGLERRYGKPVMVRVGGGTVDYVDITAYNDKRVVLDTTRLVSKDRMAKPAKDAFLDLASDELPEVEELVDEPITGVEEELAQLVAEHEEKEQAEAERGEGKKKRRRRRGRRGRGKQQDAIEAESDDEAIADAVEQAEEAAEEDVQARGTPDGGEEEGSEDQPKRRRRKRRRGRRGGKGRNGKVEAEGEQAEEESADPSPAESEETNDAPEDSVETPESTEPDDTERDQSESSETKVSKKKKSKPRRRRRKKSDAGKGEVRAAADDTKGGDDQPEPSEKSEQPGAAEIGSGYSNTVIAGAEE